MFLIISKLLVQLLYCVLLCDYYQLKHTDITYSETAINKGLLCHDF